MYRLDVISFTLAINSSLILRISTDTKERSLEMKSTAPRWSASRVTSAPSVVNELTIKTGTGISFIMTFSAVRPSMPGISTSRVTRSGLNFSIFSRPSRPSRAVATILMFGSDSSIKESDLLMNAESSMTITCIGFFTRRPFVRCWLGNDNAPSLQAR